MKIDMKSMVLGLLLGTAIVFSVAAASSHFRLSGFPAIFTDKVVAGTVFGTQGPLDDAINRSVGQGWQFVSAAHSTEHYGFAVMRREKK